MNNPLSPIKLNEISTASPGIQHNCTMAENNKYYYIDIKKLNSKELYLYEPLRKNRQILKCRDGIYVYIIASSEKEKEKNIYAVRTLSIHEIKTKHTNLIKRILKNQKREDEMKYLYYAGEFIKNGNNIQFNFMSGTYMRDYVPLIKTDTDIENNRQHIDFVKEIFHNYGMTNTDIILDDLINNKNLILSKKEINLLVMYGATVYEYNTQKDCLNHSNYEILTIKTKMQFEAKKRAYDRYKEINERNGILPPVLEELPLTKGRLIIKPNSPKKTRSSKSSSLNKSKKYHSI
jgi:hypothetical protein